MKRFSWLILAIVVVAALAFGTVRHGSKSLESRTTSLASTLRCPVCSGESVEDSQAPVSKTIRSDIKSRLASGQSPSEIRNFYVSKYGNDILLKPKTKGISLLAWLIPIGVGIAAVVLIVVLYSRWRIRDVEIASPEDQSRAQKALGL
jgi:cytochrome c-type biogenesis protein CcmH